MTVDSLSERYFQCNLVREYLWILSNVCNTLERNFKRVFLLKKLTEATTKNGLYRIRMLTESPLHTSLYQKVQTPGLEPMMERFVILRLPIEPRLQFYSFRSEEVRHKHSYCISEYSRHIQQEQHKYKGG